MFGNFDIFVLIYELGFGFFRGPNQIVSEKCDLRWPTHGHGPA